MDREEFNRSSSHTINNTPFTNLGLYGFFTTANQGDD